MTVSLITRVRAWDPLTKSMWSPEKCAEQGLYLRLDGKGLVNQFHAPAEGRFIVLPSLIEKALCGTEIFCHDIVEATAFGDRVTDLVYWDGCAWRFGYYEGVLFDYPILRVAGNIYQNAWPLNA